MSLTRAAAFGSLRFSGVSPSVSTRRWLLIPTGVKVRDLDGNLLLALAAAERGWGVILGGREIKSIPAVFSGVVVWEKNASAMPHLGIGRDGHDRLVARIVAEHDGGIALTGNPRFDPHRKDMRAIYGETVRRIREAHAPFILVNTKFSKWNGHPSRTAKRFSQLQSPAHEQEATDEIAFHRVGFEKFTELVAALSARFPDVAVVVRPHPYELLGPWQAQAATLPNVKVIRDGAAAPWILASEVCVHTNCTTGIEAFLLDREPISYRPQTDPRFDQYLPNELSSQAFDLDHVVDAVAAGLRGEPISTDTERSARMRFARQFVPNIEGALASDRIVDVLDAMAVPEQPLMLRPARLADTVRKYRARFSRLLRGDDERARYRRQLFDGLQKGDLDERLVAAQRVTGRFGNVRIVGAGADTFCIYA